ncbi:CS1 type fimbrial major subunit [Escherichia coli]|uniref:CS1 type fimbrial major subunit n=1 Tax=Escherichia coli TaxID=562 RepID=UPI001919D353|nr:CS1 type fimbrial major subunit [Escherichia coli]CAD5740850.1 cfa/I fimbrial subunit B precursor (colonization factor antigen subunit B) (cfa/I pilin) (cfa/I antigen) [Escherichia coli]
MKSKLKFLLCPVLLAPLMAMADTPQSPATATASINVSAEVAGTVALLSADSSHLSDMQLQYSPAKGLEEAKQRVKIATNDSAHGVDISLMEPLKLTDGALNKSVDMTVLLGSKPLSTTSQHFAVAQFNNGETQPMELIIKQTTPGSLDAGNYEGRLNIVLTQSTNI